MDATSSPNKNLHSFLQHLASDYPNISYVSAEKSYWDPKRNTILFNAKKTHVKSVILHETGHMILGHRKYRSDIELLLMEQAAWEEAKKISTKYEVAISDDYIEDCIDSYRDWVHKRSSCPNCSQTGLEVATGRYKCINCSKQWAVTNSRFCRSYRKTIGPDVKNIGA